MTMQPPRVPSPKLAQNDRAWPSLAQLLAPAAGCDCQMLAVTIAERCDGEQPGEPRKIAER